MTVLLASLQNQYDRILSGWIQQLRATLQRRDLLSTQDLESEASEVLNAILKVAPETKLEDFGSPAWRPLKDLLSTLSVSRATLGFTPSETALFVLSLKPVLFQELRLAGTKDADALFAAIETVDGFVDKLALHTTDSYIQGRDRVIARQQEDMLELSTPVVMLWDGIVALPLIGTLDSARTQVVMESLLHAIVETNSRYAIIDITGVATVDTLVAQHLLKTITAARLMGAECILSGIRPQIAQTIVHLGINLEDIVTKAKLADAFRMALEQSGRKVVRVERQPAHTPVKAY
ncbi:MAG: STAS domain-containing protein [Janthinobacterium lividum]